MTSITSDDILENLQDQLSNYQHMLKREEADIGNKTAGSCAYLNGAVAASQRAVEMVERIATGVNRAVRQRQS
jgi:hypothetical protein